MNWSRIRNNGCKGHGSAPGYWGRDIFRRVLSENEHNRQRTLLEDQIRASGIRAELWTRAETGSRCACYKESSRSSDRKCRSCYGASIVPGYYKFGYNTEFLSASDDDAVLTDVGVTTDFKSAKVILDDTALTGTIESSDKAFTRSAIESEWEYEDVFFDREGSVLVEYSLDSGSTWKAMSELTTENPASGNIRFRATLSRAATTDLSPLFEIVRARYATIDKREISIVNNDYRWGPWIFIMNTIPDRQYIKTDRGDIPKQSGLTFWTAGLSMFDPSIEIGSDEELITGPGVLIKILDGVMEGNRYITTTWRQSDPFAYKIIQQEFHIRVEDSVGPYSLVF